MIKAAGRNPGGKVGRQPARRKMVAGKTRGFHQPLTGWPPTSAGRETVVRWGLKPAELPAATAGGPQFPGATQPQVPPQSAQHAHRTATGVGCQLGHPAPAIWAHTSPRLNPMSSSDFTLARRRVPGGDYFFPTFASASAALIFLRYFAGFLRKSFRQDLQQSLTSWPS